MTPGTNAMQPNFQRIKSALEDLKQGKMVILTDAPDRENEGDLIIAAEKITPEKMNFLIRNGSGIVCISMTETQLNKLNLPLMVPESNTSETTAFTVSVDAKDGIESGVSAHDRVTTINALINKNANPDDLIKPGHIFPLKAKEGGVFERQGHTEGSMDLVKLAGLTPAAILCELMNEDGSMTKGEMLVQFSKKHQINIITINDIIAYRLEINKTLEKSKE